jgi:membrane-associated phospholipid phosphatase
VTKHSPAKFTRWFFLPPLAALLLLGLVPFAGEKQVFLGINRMFQFPGDMFWIGVTTFGDGLVVCVLVLPFVRRKPELVWAMLLSWLFVTLWVQGVKFSFNEPRPLAALSINDFHIIGAHYRSKSFPSGHAATAGMFAAIFWLSFRQRWMRVAVILLAVLISLSRLVMGLHWPTDVLVGFASGWLLAGLGYYLAMRFRFGSSRVAQVIFGLILLSGAIMMMTTNHTDYAQAFRLQQLIALACLMLTCYELFVGFRRVRRDPRHVG